MYWTYLCGKKESTSNILTLESNDNLQQLSEGYCELVLEDFFSCFGSDYDYLFISEFSPDQNPLEKDKKFLIKFNDYEFANKYLKENKISYSYQELLEEKKEILSKNKFNEIFSNILNINKLTEKSF